MHSFLRFVSLQEDFKTAQQKFLQSNPDLSPQDISNAFTQFRQLSSQNKLKGDEKNIDWWAKQGWDSFQKFVSNQTNIAVDSKYKDQVTLRDDDEWLIVVPTNHQASCFHGSGTDWCTTKPEQPYFNQYFYDNNVTLVYCIQKKTKKKWAISWSKTEPKFFNARDVSIDESEFERQTGLDMNDIRRLIAQQHSTIEARRKQNKETDLGHLLSFDSYDLSDDQRDYIRANLSRITQNAGYAYKYAKNFIGKEFPDGEPAMSKNPEIAYTYANSIVMGAFPAGEPSIAKVPQLAYKYAENVLYGPFPAGEPAIATNAELAFDYAIQVLKGPFPAGEPEIAKHSDWSFVYAKQVLKGTDVPADILASIARDRRLSLEYASFLLRNSLPIPKVIQVALGGAKS